MELEVTTHSGTSDIVEEIEYDASAMEEKMNDDNVQAIAIGVNVYSRIDLKSIKPVDKEEE